MSSSPHSSLTTSDFVRSYWTGLCKNQESFKSRVFYIKRRVQLVTITLRTTTSRIKLTTSYRLNKSSKAYGTHTFAMTCSSNSLC